MEVEFVFPIFEVVDYCIPYRFKFFHLSSKEPTEPRENFKLGQRFLRYQVHDFEYRV